MKKAKQKLQGFGGSQTNVLGKVFLDGMKKGTEFNLKFYVVDISHNPLLSAKTSLSLGLIKLCNATYKNNDKRAEEIKLEKEAEDLVKKYKDIFNGYGCLKDQVDLEVDKNIKPVIQKARRIPIHLREKLKNELDLLVKKEIITKVEKHNDRVSNILLVSKKEKLRICLDPIPLNQALKRPNYQFATIDEILPELGKAKIFSTVDTKKGFWHVKLNEKSSKLTTFWTPFGRYRWLRMPFGIASAPEIFQIKMQNMVTWFKRHRNFG